jgi:hypothetical protein
MKTIPIDKYNETSTNKKDVITGSHLFDWPMKPRYGGRNKQCCEGMCKLYENGDV